MGRFCTCMKMKQLFFFRLQSCHNSPINQLINLLDFSVPSITGGVTEKRTKHGGFFCCWMKGSAGTGDKRHGSSEASTFILKDGWEAFSLAGLKILLVKLLLSLVELPQLLGLPFAQLLPLRIVSGETLRAATNLIGFCLNLLLQQQKNNNKLLPFHQIWNTCRFQCGTFHLEGPSSSPV